MFHVHVRYRDGSVRDIAVHMSRWRADSYVRRRFVVTDGPVSMVSVKGYGVSQTFYPAQPKAYADTYGSPV